MLLVCYWMNSLDISIKIYILDDADISVVDVTVAFSIESFKMFSRTLGLVMISYDRLLTAISQ